MTFEIEGIRHDLEQRAVTTFRQQASCTLPAGTTAQQVIDAARASGISSDQFVQADETFSNVDQEIWKLPGGVLVDPVIVNPSQQVNPTRFVFTFEYKKLGNQVLARQNGWEADKFRVFRDGILALDELSTATEAVQVVQTHVNQRIAQIVQAHIDFDNPGEFDDNIRELP